MTAFSHQATSLRRIAVGSIGSSASTGDSFIADLPVEAYGLVLDYPGLFKTAYPSRHF